MRHCDSLRLGRCERGLGAGAAILVLVALAALAAAILRLSTAQQIGAVLELGAARASQAARAFAPRCTDGEGANADQKGVGHLGRYEAGDVGGRAAL